MSLLFQMPEISVGNWHILALFCSSKEHKPFRENFQYIYFQFCNFSTVITRAEARGKQQVYKSWVDVLNKSI